VFVLAAKATAGKQPDVKRLVNKKEWESRWKCEKTSVSGASSMHKLFPANPEVAPLATFSMCF